MADPTEADREKARWILDRSDRSTYFDAIAQALANEREAMRERCANEVLMSYGETMANLSARIRRLP